MVWNIIWRGCKPQYIGVGPDVKTACEQGVIELKDLKQVQQFTEDQSVSFGEEGGNFHLFGGWEGRFKDLKKGKSDFYTEERLFERINYEKER